MTTRSRFLGAAGGIAVAMRLAPPAAAQAPRANILLVHGALLDGSSWRLVIPFLQAAGHNVVGVTNPLTSFADDVENTTQQLAQLSGPTVLVGHSYGGCVITEVSRDKAIKSLVYVTALAPDAGESAGDLVAKYPLPSGDHFVPSGPHGFIIIDPATFHADFAGDLSAADAAVMAAVQRPTAIKTFSAKLGAPGWKQAPAYYAISTEDRAIDPRLQTFLAARMNASRIEIAASHVSLLSHPHEVAALILRAAA